MKYKIIDTDNGYCYKNEQAFNSGIGVCYIAECDCDEYEFNSNNEIDIPDSDLDRLIYEGGVSTRQSIIDNVKLFLDEYNFVFDSEEQKEKFAEQIGACAFDIVDWQCINTYLNEIDFEEEYNYFMGKEN